MGVGMAGKTKEDSQKTKKLILDAAELVFMERGLSVSTMADIAQKAGVSRGAVYNHYQNKIDVCVEMIKRAIGDEALKLPRVPASAKEALIYVGLFYLERLINPSSIQRVVAILFGRCENNSENEKVIRCREFMDRFAYSFIYKQIKRGIEQGEFPKNLDKKMCGVYLMAMFDRLLAHGVVVLPYAKSIVAASVDALETAESLRVTCK